MFSIDEINELAIGQLSPTELERALAAFNGFAALFNKDWVAGYFQGVRSPAFVRAVLAIWDDWVIIRNLPRAETLVERWRAGISEGGVQTEVRVFSRLLRGRAVVELFPEVGDRVPDCRFRPNYDHDWVYLEASQRGLSNVRQHAQVVLMKISETAANAVAGMHGKVAIVQTPTHDDVEKIVAWLASGPASGDKFEDVAEFYLDAATSPVGPDDILQQRLPGPRMFSTHLALGGARRGTACIGISDEGAEELLKTEAAQLPLDSSGVVVLDVSAVIGGHREWAPLIQRRLQPKINTRISAVVHLETALAKEGPVSNGQVLTNTHARNPITEEVGELLEKVVES